MSADVLRDVAKLHCQGIRRGFISSLGLPFVRTMYRGIGRAPGACVLTRGGLNGPVEGFVAGTVNTRRMFRWILPRYGARLALRLLFRLFSPIVLKNALETVIYIGRRSDRDDDSGEPEAATESTAELLAIAVSAEYRNKGVGRGLITDFECFLRAHSCDRYKVVTDAGDAASNGFYEASGFSLSRSFLHHGQRMNEYVKVVAPKVFSP
jgi:GNAT superfamily N-acetyltransferase